AAGQGDPGVVLRARRPRHLAAARSRQGRLAAMRLGHKIALLLLAAATVPLATAGFQLIARNQRALEAAVRDTLDQTARHAAAVVAGDIEGRARQLTQTAQLIAWDKLSPAELDGALEILKRQTHASSADFVQQGAQAAERIAAPYARALREGP